MNNERASMLVFLALLLQRGPWPVSLAVCLSFNACFPGSITATAFLDIELRRAITASMLVFLALLLQPLTKTIYILGFYISQTQEYPVGGFLEKNTQDPPPRAHILR